MVANHGGTNNNYRVNFIWLQIVVVFAIPGEFLSTIIIIIYYYSLEGICISFYRRMIVNLSCVKYVG